MTATMKEIYVAMLRGINLGGKNTIKMTELVKTFESMGFQDVKTYIQSGNVVFKAESLNRIKLEAQIHSQISEDFGLDVPVLVLESMVLEEIRNENPFVERDDIDLTKLHVTFLEIEPDKVKVAAINPEKYLPDEFMVKGKTVYLHCPVAYGTTKLNNGFFENKLKVKATTRNWNTVNKLVEMTRA